MDLLRQYVLPALILLVFLFTLVVVSIRSFLPQDMAQPAPIEEAPPVALSGCWMPAYV
ncbi:hypothetical protein [Synechococcus sp. O70.2]|jgi:hypothetical protein|uniref:hypothetical protein n=1 Tax=unclassified Synechococcus TaxID=2626047 RepID=UPI0039C12D4C